LAIDHTSDTTKGKNYFWAMKQASKMDPMTFMINIDYQFSTSTITLGGAVKDPATDLYESSVGF